MADVKHSAGRQDSFAGLCREHNLKITPQRTAIYGLLKGCTDHPSADYVYRQIRQEFPNISFETVNRTLLTFAAIGLIAIVESTAGVRRFDPDMESHHHIHCIRCGTIIDFRHEGFDGIAVPESLSEKYSIIGKRVVLHVICPRCRQQEAAGMQPPG
ncbi:MAG: transcriptional repressor [Chlorobium sp.]|uniref:Fur family transcriptional regulator n=1 Tax=Chlorobium sp. TaxID=1095 RepID=UPI001E18290B|nr:Fur family transcriptional regulator [Chlorobium sp.]MBN1278723.1 transcriptional repressor [Chlorobiaceae bacterium]MCF8216763.1 transcriptional repressor [Chlorobium sp.]MCF8271631.1 transcriptional repressor [Chlorobium sp.]MCF8288003.1 transcriptional repressor [Chlorobium sp.]MCF8291548.1 transcriptional repressor [Chlorobium sp.]